MNGSPQVGGYSFYLNVVVINTNSSETRTESGGTVSDDVSNTTSKEETSIPSNQTSNEESTDQIPEEPSQEGADNTDEGTGEIIPVSPPRTEDPKVKLLVESKALMDFAFGRVRGQKFRSESAGAKNKDGRGFMSSIGSSISKSSSNISKRASRFMASKTMVSRAEKAVVECIPLVTEEIGVEMSISKRFQQGPVFVLEVDMKGCEILDLLKKVQGEEAARQYVAVKEGLEFLGLPDAQEAFLKEILPKLRKAMMEKMSEIVPEKMKLKKAYADLEIQCVALEDAEEAKWLYNFLAFMEEMK
ncbi:hypothetical protein ACA910_011266 [Epithemia clementina (nom. ined.)]